MVFKIEKAERIKLKSRILIEGQAGSGKTYSALLLARNLGKKICVIDTEDKSASLYDDLVDFDVINMPAPFSPNNLVLAINQLEENKYDVIVVDSLSAFWASTGGAVEMAKNLGGNSFTAWDKITPIQNKMLDKILHCKAHIICCAKVKTDYIMEEYVNAQGKTSVKPVKVGLKTIQREGLDYEFTVVFRLDRNHIATVDKTRCPVFDNYTDIITDDTAKKLLNWLEKGKEIKKSDKNDHIGVKIAQCNTYQELIDLYNVDRELSQQYNNLFVARREQIEKEENHVN